MKAIRFIFAVILLGIVTTLGFYLYQKQKNQYTYASFQQQGNTVLFINVDRLLRQLKNKNNLALTWSNPKIESGIRNLLASNVQEISQLVGKSCLITENETEFTIVFQKWLDWTAITRFLENNLNVTANFTENSLTINGETYRTEVIGKFTTVSTSPLQPKVNAIPYIPGNVDYLTITDSTYTKYVHSKGHVFKVWTRPESPVRGRPIIHRSFTEKVPLDFDEVVLYGSKRFQEDRLTFFTEMPSENLAWVGEGLMLIKKDSFQIMIGEQNEGRDLKLMLEEQTIKAQGDSGQINYLNIINYQIMPFKTTFGWEKGIAELTQPLRYYTELENFNVMANSIAAMRWYLSEIQTDNLFLKEQNLANIYVQSLPLKTHKITMTKPTKDDNNIRFQSETWRRKNEVTSTLTTINKSGAPVDEETAFEFAIDFKPEYIQLIEKNGDILITGVRTIACYDAKGNQKWRYSSAHDIKQVPQLIDLENNGKRETAIFNTKGMIVLDNSGKPIPALTLQNESNFKKGICLNYDNNYNYRFLLVNGNKIDYFDEQGKRVDGWQFTASKAEIVSVLHYTQIQRKDYISFKDAQNNQYILNRRGENRFNKMHQFKLPSESSFLSGTNEGHMRKVGYKNQYIYSYFVRDGYADSVKLDKRVNPWEVNWIQHEGVPILVVEEASRVLLFNAFGYLETELLKPEGVGQFLGVVEQDDFNYVFFNKSQNSLYLLNSGGKLRLKTNQTDELYGISKERFCTYDGNQIKVHTLN